MDQSTEIVIESFVARAKMEGYLHLPFEVPPGTGRLEVQYTYDFKIGAEPEFTDGNTIDIGIFDQRGPIPAGFRGWSGSDRTTFFIAHNDATPGYMPGPIERGTWNICLGLYKLSPEGCHYTVTIRLYPAEIGAQLPVFPPLLGLERIDQQMQHDCWHRGELHCHTVHSDGDGTVAEVIERAGLRNLDFLAITDHNTLTHWAAQAPVHPSGFILIPGYEVTTYKGHWNIWGGDGFIDFRIETPDQMRACIASAKEHGYLVSCNHPRHFGCEWQFTDVLDHDCFEVWNGPWNSFNEEALALWDGILSQGRRLNAVGGSDCHRMDERYGIKIGVPTTWIYCSGAPSAAALLDGLRHGHAFLCDGRDEQGGPQIYLAAGTAIMGDEIRRPASGELPVHIDAPGNKGLSLEIYSAAGRIFQTKIESEDGKFDLSLPVTNTPYVRAQLVEGDRVRALTNPLYVR